MKNLKYICLVAFVTACSTTPSKKMPDNYEVVKPRANEVTPVKPQKPSVPVIDYASIQRLLHLDKGPSELGYAEKIFNTCEVGFGYSNTDCQKKYFVVLHFKLTCRDSEGTISNILTDDDLKPIAGERVNWFLKNANGSVQTDSGGYGQVVMVSAESQKNQRLRLAVATDFLFLKAGEVGRLIAPKSWCRDSN
ncbi:MAG: hypothetical protein WA160_03920 [Pseudobdellovibrio sp.]